MKTTFEIIEATAELYMRFGSEMPYKYMNEVFGKDDDVLADKCLQTPKRSSHAFLQLIWSLKSDERKALAKYINKRIVKY